MIPKEKTICYEKTNKIYEQPIEKWQILWCT